MSNLLALDTRPLLVITDYDGTLAPIVLRPEDALPQRGAREALEALLAHPTYRLIVLTGRQRDEVLDFIGLENLHVVGLHGMEWPGEPLPVPDRSALEFIRGDLPEFANRRLEDKGRTLAVHYREAPPEEHPEIEAALAALSLPPGWEIVAGKMVREFRPAGFGKGRALERLAREHPGHHPVFIGDDLTDEEGFAVLRRLGGTSVKVGEGLTLAEHRIGSPADVVALLAAWAASRTPT